MRREGAVSPAEQTTQLDGSVENTPLGRGKAVSDTNWDAPSSGYLAIIPTGIALAPMPSGSDGTPGQYFKPSMFLGVSANTGHAEEAAQLVDFLLNDRDAAKILGATRGIPVNETIREETAPLLKDFDKTVADYQASLEGKLKDPPQAPPSGRQRPADHLPARLRPGVLRAHVAPRGGRELRHRGEGGAEVMTTTAIPTAEKRATAATTKRRTKRERQGAAWVFLSPWVLGASVLTLLPMAVSLYLSFTDYNLFDPPHWVGLRNYTQMFTEDPRYWRSVIDDPDVRRHRRAAPSWRSRSSSRSP